MPHYILYSISICSTCLFLHFMPLPLSTFACEKSIVISYKISRLFPPFFLIKFEAALQFFKLTGYIINFVKTTTNSHPHFPHSFPQRHNYLISSAFYDFTQNSENAQTNLHYFLFDILVYIRQITEDSAVESFTKKTLPGLKGQCRVSV